MKYFLKLILFFISINLFSDIRIVNRTAGLKELQIGISLEQTINILERYYRIKISDRDIKREEIEINPYDILKKHISDSYKSFIKNNEIVIQAEYEIFNYELKTYIKKEEDYFIDLLDTSIDNNLFYFFNKNRKYFILYKHIKLISLEEKELKFLNPLLLKLDLFFFNNILYKIIYKASFDLDEIDRFIANYKQRFRTNKIGEGENIFFQNPYFYRVILPENIDHLLERINFYRADNKKFKNHIIVFEMSNSNIIAGMKLYKNNCYNIFSNNLTNLVLKKIEKAKIAIKSKIRENQIIRNRINIQTHQFVDEL